MPKVSQKIIKQIAQIAKQTGEAVVKEPLEILKTAGQQTGLSSKGEKGIETPQSGGVSDKQLAQIKKKQKEDQKKLEFYRKRLKELTAPPAPPLSEEERQKILEKEAKKEKEKEKAKGLITAPGEASKRGTALMGRRKRSKGSGEMVAAKRSK